MIEVFYRPLTDHEAFLGDWRDLFALSDQASFFQSPYWMSAWLQNAPRKARLFQIGATVNGVTVALGVVSAAPRTPPVLGLQESWFFEFGDTARDAVYIEYNDLLIATDAPSETRESIFNGLFEAMGGNDNFVLRNLRPEAVNAVRARAEVHELYSRTLHEQPVYVCDLTQGETLDGLSKSLQTKIRRSKSLYESRGALTAGVAQSDSEKSAAWDALVRLHGESWKARGKPSVFDNPNLVSFHNALATAAPNALDLFVVKVGDETIAVLYNFIHEKRVMNYQTGLKFEDDNRLAPGFVAHFLAAEHYQRAGFETYDLLAGDADYKQRLGTVETTLTSLVLERPTWRNRLRSLIKR